MTTIFNPKYNFYQLMNGVFLLEIDGNNDLGHTFLRAQEFYESVNSNMQGKAFSMEEYKEWYKSQSDTGEFTYGEDWLGFNLPSSSIEECYRVNKERLQEDDFFLSIVQMCKNEAKENGLENYYLLGVRKGDTETLDHELAHGLYTVNQDYKNACDVLIKRLPKEVKDHLYSSLTEKGYASSVHDDEIQAFLSTGLSDIMDEELLEPFEIEFKENFKSFVPEFKLPPPLIKNIGEDPFKQFAIGMNSAI